jgi:predicted amidohydrolase YtcJ
MKSARIRILLAGLLVLTTASSSSPQKPKPADLIFINGNIYAGALPETKAIQPKPEDQRLWTEQAPEPTRFGAMAISGGKIVAIGLDAANILQLKGPKTEVIDLGGNFVMPGFNDAHTHLSSAGFQKLDIDLVGTKSLEEMKQRIAAGTKTAAPGEWLIGRGWDHTLWSDSRLPARQDLDSVTGDHPGVFIRVDGHIAVVNSAGLKAAGIGPQTQDPHGGKIDRDANGEATGILRETAKDSLIASLPKPTATQRRRALELALQDAARWGITSAQDYSEWEDFLLWEQMEREGKLTLRISEWLTFDAPLEELERQRSYHPADDPMLHTAMLKGFMDGSLGSRTAALLAPYADDPKNSGLPRYEQDALNRKTVERAKAGFQIGFHAIGDRAVRMALNAFEAAEQQSEKRDFRFRIEHAQLVQMHDLVKFKDLGVIASMQPNHLLTDMNWAEARLGPDRAEDSYDWREFLDDSIPLAFGTDYPVEPITPFRGLYAAVTRKNEAGTRQYYPEEKISIEQAIAAYTTGAAYAQFAEKEKGVLQPGMLADFVVLDRDILKASPADILKTRVLRTVVGGKTVYQAE